METILKTAHGKLIHGDNIDVMKKIPDNTVDSCVSDFPYAIEFMGKNWDSSKHWHDGEGGHSEFKGTGYDGKRRPDFYKNSKEDKIIFYDWCYERAVELFRIIKSGGYVCIFGHPKTNHRMKSAFEDAGFNIVEEIDWVYGTGFPKNQDIGKLFDKKAGVGREVVGTYERPDGTTRNYENWNDKHFGVGDEKADRDRVKGNQITEPSTDLAKKWNGWKTAGLKPAHEPITVFQKPLEGTYIQNIEKYGCGGMNIDATRIEGVVGFRSSGGFNSGGNSICYGDSKGVKNTMYDSGRFPANMVFDSTMGKVLDSQSGISKSTGGSGDKSKGALGDSVYGKYKNEELSANAGGLGDTGGASRYFLNIDADDFVPFYYCAKATKKEKGEGNTHVTVKPKELIKWLIKLVTPIDGKTIDITAGSGTHGLSCEELNKYDGYNLKWVNVEMMNTEDEPYCEIGKRRIEEVLSK